MTQFWVAGRTRALEDGRGAVSGVRMRRHVGRERTLFNDINLAARRPVVADAKS